MSFGLVINHNLGSMSALSALDNTQNALQKELKQLSTGKKINSAADDAAGYAISQKMQSQIQGLNQASQNSQDGISMIQTASGALNETQSILQRMRQLAVQASNDTNTTQDRKSIQQEVTQLTSEIDAISNDTQYNKLDLLNGDAGTKVSYLTDSSVTYASATSQTQTGSYSVSVSSAAAQSKMVGAAAPTGGTGTYDISNLTNGTSYSITINGNAVNFTAGSDANATLNAAAKAITDAGIGITATTDSATAATKLTLTSNSYGKTSDFTVSGSSTAADLGLTANATTANATGSISTVTGGTNTAGADVTGTIDGANATGDGLTLTATTGNASGLSVSLTTTAATATGSAGSVDVQQNELTLQVGANNQQTMTVSIAASGSADLGVNGLDVTTQPGAESAITKLDSAIQQVSNQQANLGAYQNRLQDTITNLSTSSQNLTTAQSGITDTNMASAMANFTKDNVLQQAAISMLAQANQQPQLVLKLLG